MDEQVEQTDEDFAAAYKKLLEDVSKNPAQVEFPRDTWGMTTELRKAGLRVASSIRGNPEKLKIYLATLSILAMHARARMIDDAKAVQVRAAEIDARNLKERVYGTAVPAPAAEAAIPIK